MFGEARGQTLDTALDAGGDPLPYRRAAFELRSSTLEPAVQVFGDPLGDVPLRDADVGRAVREADPVDAPPCACFAWQ